MDYKDTVKVQDWSPNAATTGPAYDERFDWGKSLAAIGVVLWIIGAVVYTVRTSSGPSGDDSSFDQAANAVTGFVWGGAIFAFGCFVMGCGVILIAGAQRVDR